MGDRGKVDVLVLKNGDRVTGEIQSLAYGRLALDTDSMGTVQIEWPDVVSLESAQGFMIEDVSGNLFYGHFAVEPQSGHVAVTGADQITRRLPTLQIARISQSEERVVDRLHGSFSLGVDYTRSSEITVVSGNFNTNYRGLKSSWSFNADVNSTRDPTQGTIDRNSVRYGYRWLQPGARFWAGVSSLERNEQTGIEARLLVGGGYGKFLLQSSSQEVAAVAGVGATREWATGAADDQTSLEAILGLDWQVFDFASPKTSLSARAVLFPSLTESGRYRTDANVSLRREIVTDFFLDLSFYHNYDSDPPDEFARSSDYGVVTSLGYSF
jgi:hypothetical protein